MNKLTFTIGRTLLQYVIAAYQQVFGFDIKISEIMKDRQLEICRKMMFAFIPVGLAFAVINMMTQHIAMGLADVIFSLGLLYSSLYVRHRYLLGLALILGYGINIVAFVDGAMEHMGALGFMVMPFVYFAILGQKKAWLSLIFFIGMLEFLVWVMPDAVAYNLQETQVIVMVLIILSIICSYLNALSLSYQSQLEEKEIKTSRHLNEVKKASELESQAWQETINQLHDVLLILDADGHVLHANQLAMNMYPSLAHARGMHWQGLLQGDLHQSGKGIDIFPEDHEDFEQGMILDLNQRWLSISFTSLHIESFTKWAGVLVCRDITERYEKEQKEAKQYIYLQALQHMKVVMTSSLSTVKVLDNLMHFFLQTFQADRAWVLHANPWHEGMYNVVCQATQGDFPHSFITGNDFALSVHDISILEEGLEGNRVNIPHYSLGDQYTQSQMIVSIPNHLTSKYWVILDMCQEKHEWQASDIQLFEEMAFRMVNILNAWQLNVSLTWREDQYQQLVDNLPNGVLVLQEDNVVFANEVALQMTGLDDIQGFKDYTLSSFIPESFKTMVKQCFQQAINSKVSPIIDVQMHDIYGDTIDVILTASSIFYEGKVSLQLVIMDVTRQKEQHQALLSLSKKNAQLAQKMIDLQEEERRMIAQDLHDDSGQLLTALSMNLSSVRMNIKDVALSDRISESEAIVQRIFTSIRSTLNTLNPTHIETLGLSNALRSAVDAWTACHRVPVILYVSNKIDAKPCLQTTAIYRIIQEALTNIAKYAQASEVKINVYEDEDDRSVIILEILDQGCGFDVEKADHRGFGLLGMRTRAEYAGGTLLIHSEIGKGTHIYGRFLAGGGSSLT